jgi:hypothetical protein
MRAVFIGSTSENHIGGRLSSRASLIHPRREAYRAPRAASMSMRLRFGDGTALPCLALALVVIEARGTMTEDGAVSCSADSIRRQTGPAGTG